MVPHLITALSGSLSELEQRILESRPAIERWFRLEWMEHTPPLYSSIDVRNGGFKLAAVDSNLFPGNWNHLTTEMIPLAVQAARAAIDRICPETTHHLLIIPENSSFHPDYAANLAQLVEIFELAGFQVRLGSIHPDITQTTHLKLPSGKFIKLEPVLRQKGRLSISKFNPCTILLNNDLVAGVPGILEELRDQIVAPPLHAGWSTRRKSQHFQSHEEISKRFSKMLGIDPWLINPLTTACGELDLTRPSDIANLKIQVDALMMKIRRKYKEYGIHERPFVTLKADNAMNGQSVTIRDVRDLDHLEKSPLKQLFDPSHFLYAPYSVSQQPTEWMIQEGILTTDIVNGHNAEPVVYMIERYVVGGFYRSHPNRRADESFNTLDAHYTPMSLAHNVRESEPNRFYMYGVIARLATLACSYELEATDPDAEVY